MSEGRRGGERRRHAPQSTCTRRRHERSSHALGDASFARSFDPCTSILTMHLGRNPSVVRQSRWHHGWANLRKQEEPALGPSRMDGARLAPCPPLPQGRERGTEEKDGGRGLPPCEDGRARVWLPARRIVVAEVGRRRLVLNTLGKRAPKRAAGSSEQGSSSKHSSVGGTAVG
jgi:hypothetical protein